MPKTKRRRAVARVRRVAKAHRVNPHRRRKNSTRIVVMPRHVRHNRRARRNPVFFGQQMNAGRMVKVIAGGLVGVGGTKLIVSKLPATFTSNPAFQFVSAVAVAFAIGWAGGKVSPDFGNAVMFGGLMEAASIGLNNFLPVQQYTGLSGFQSARFPLPAQPLLAPAGYGGGGGVTPVYPARGNYARRAA